jgi:uncharacterized protein YbjT (DUF2867 family)
MKILIIGGTGLISTAITRFLLERSDDTFEDRLIAAWKQLGKR